MRDRNKGFTLVELLVTVCVMAILIMIAVPSYTTSMNNAKADTETSDLYRALNFARLEAINRAVNVRITPTTAGTWTSSLNVQPVAAGSGATATLGGVLRVVPAMAASAAVNAANVAYIEYNNLGALNFPATALTLAYTRGTISKTIGVCVSGRLILGGACP